MPYYYSEPAEEELPHDGAISSVRKVLRIYGT